MRSSLIVAGALEKEVVLRSFLGNVARRLVREAPCSVILFTKPEREPKSLKSIVFFVPDYSEHARSALQRATSLAEREGRRISTPFVFTPPSTKRGPSGKVRRKRAPSQKKKRLWKISSRSAGHTDIPIDARCVRGNTGFVASDFVQSVEADLLVVPIERSKSNELPAHIAWVTDVIPCNLWIIR